MPSMRLRIAALFLGVLAAPVLRADEAEAKLRGMLAVQAALVEAEEHVRRGTFTAAVALLEKHVAHIDGNRRYLSLLRDAYKGAVVQLRAAGHLGRAARMHERLLILQPSAAADRVPAPAIASATPAATAPAAAAVSMPRLAIRGKSAEQPDDPFSEANRALPAGVPGLVERAEKAFAARDYERAGRLFEDAEATQPGSTASSKERRAYCKLHRVARLINGDGIPAGDELEQEVEAALRLAPSLGRFASSLRDKMKEATASVTVRHTPREGKGWAMAETANFRIFHATSEARATRAARLAEAARTAMARKWLGGVLPDWKPRCDIYLHPTVVGYTRSTKAPATHPGHSSIGMVGGKVASRRVDLRMDDPNLWTCTLPHETTHVVLAGSFGKHHLPRWADEGIAVLSEARERPGMHTQMLPGARREGKLFRLETLLKLDDYPDAARVPLFYAQSISLVDYLVRRKDAVTLSRFVRDGLEGGYEAALLKHYGFKGFGELEQEWMQATFTDPVAKVSLKRR